MQAMIVAAASLANRADPHLDPSAWGLEIAALLFCIAAVLLAIGATCVYASVRMLRRIKRMEWPAGDGRAGLAAGVRSLL